MNAERGTYWVTACELRVADAPWPFAELNRSAIMTHWQRRSSQNSTLFNGGVFILRDPRIEGGIFRGTYYATDFASFLYWRDMGFNDPGTYDGFASAMVRAADGGYLIGRAAPGSLNDGLFVFPGGLVDARDVRDDGLMDIVGTARRELVEETGLDPDRLVVEPGLQVVRMGPLIGFGATFVARDSQSALLRRVRHHLATSDAPELFEPQFISHGEDLTSRPLVESTRLLLEAAAS